MLLIHHQIGDWELWREKHKSRESAAENAGNVGDYSTLGQVAHDRLIGRGCTESYGLKRK
jgi:hypothetical protein